MPGGARSIVNAGEDIGERRGRALGKDDLEGMPPSEAEALVRKDAVWPAPDWRALVAQGVEPRAAALIKIVRDRIPTRPAYGIRQFGIHYSVRRERDADLVRRDYVRMLSIVRDAYMACRTVEEVRAARSASLDAAGWTPRADHETRHLVTSVWRDRLDTLQIDYRDNVRAEAMVHGGWPGGPVPTWRRGHAVRGDGEGGYLLAKGVRIVADGFASEEDAWEWLRRDVEASRAARPRRAALPTRPAVKDPVRAGLPERRDGDVPVLAFLDAFGLRAVEFGKWVPQAERQTLLNRTFDALHDLADALGVAPAAIGLGGTLALSFGARASGGAGANYDPGARVIALPRASGAGELARCWAYAFDHWAGGPAPSEAPHAAGRATGRALRGGAPLPDLSHLPPEAAAAWTRLTEAMWRRDPAGAAEEAAVLRADIARREAEIAEAERQREAFLARAPGAAGTPQGARYLDELARWLRARRESVIPGLAERLAGIEARASAESDYAAEARRLCGRDGDYWARPGEVFARAFEAHVHDRLRAEGGRNEFLVHGVEADRFAEGFRGNPYPTGEERRRIGEALAEVVAAMVPRLEPTRLPGGAAEGEAPAAPVSVHSP